MKIIQHVINAIREVALWSLLCIFAWPVGDLFVQGVHSARLKGICEESIPRDQECVLIAEPSKVAP